MSRNGFFNRKLDSTNSLESRGVGTRQLLVAGPTWLVYGTGVSEGDETYVAGRTEQQFAQEVGGEEYQFGGDTAPIGNIVPTIANGLL